MLSTVNNFQVMNVSTLQSHKPLDFECSFLCLVGPFTPTAHLKTSSIFWTLALRIRFSSASATTNSRMA
jgi:hypothetical protein